MMAEFYTENIACGSSYNAGSGITLHVRYKVTAIAVFRFCYLTQKLADSLSALARHPSHTRSF